MGLTEGELRLVAYMFGQLGGRHRPAKQITLYLIAGVLTEELQLLLGLDPLGDYFHVQAVCHGDDGPGDLRILFAVGQAVDEAAVDFQHIDGELLEVIERRVTGAKIINRDAQPEFFQLGQGLQGVGDIAHQDAFGQLQFEAGSWRVMQGQDLGNPLAKLAVLELAGG